VTRSFLALLVFLAPRGTGAGRDGIDRLRTGDAAGAEERFRAAIAAQPPDEVASPAAASLLAASWVGLGLARLGQGDPTGAADSFEEAATWVADDSSAALALYGAGTALARAERWEAARDRLQRALLLRPEYADARHNLEVVLRRLQGPPPAGGRPPEPSEFARRLRARADSLVARRRYGDALRLLHDGLSRDSTVAAFADVIQRLEAVVGIVDSAASPPLR
jgi:tetratricopeptide (TPR) repeat protein